MWRRFSRRSNKADPALEPGLVFRQIHPARQPGDGRQRVWYRAGTHTDLQLQVVACDLVGLDFCYPGEDGVMLYRWRQDQPVWHGRIDMGEDRPGKAKASPLLQARTPVDTGSLGAWLDQSEGLPEALKAVVVSVLQLSPAGPVPLPANVLIAWARHPAPP